MYEQRKKNVSWAKKEKSVDGNKSTIYRRSSHLCWPRRLAMNQPPETLWKNIDNIFLSISLSLSLSIFWILVSYRCLPEYPLQHLRIFNTQVVGNISYKYITVFSSKRRKKFAFRNVYSNSIRVAKHSVESVVCQANVREERWTMNVQNFWLDLQFAVVLLVDAFLIAKFGGFSCALI